MAKRQPPAKFSVGGAPIFGNPQGVTGKGNSGGWGVGNPKSKPAGGQNPAQNPFLLPKPAGLNITSQTFPSMYYVEWNITTWRAACEQVMRQGWAISYAALTTWAFTSSPFIQGLFNKLGRALDKIPFFVVDEKGNQIPDWTLELCSKPWQIQLRQEILFSYFWGFSGINFDPIEGKVYKYPQQEVDPINRLLKSQTYSFYDGTTFEENQNLLFVQPSTNYEAFLGWMQPITRLFVQMNLAQNNWIAAGTRLAFPILMVGYAQDDLSYDSTNTQVENPYKFEALKIARDISPTEAQVFPFTVNAKGEVQKGIITEFESPHTAAQQHLIFKDFDSTAKSEIEQMIFGRAMTQGTSKGGNRALGEVEERAVDDTIEALCAYVKAVLNESFLTKIAKFYTNFPKGISFDYDSSKQLTIADITAMSTMLVANGYKFTPQFLENSAGLAKGDFEAAPVAQEKPPQIEPELQMANQKKVDLILLGSEYANLTPPKSKKRLIIDQLADDEKKYIYTNPSGRIIFTPVYKAYSKLFFRNIIDHTSIKTDYDLFKDTSIYERYMLNACQFSAAKSRAEAKMLQQLVYKDGKLQDYGRFKKEAAQVTDIFQKTWLRTEYDTSTRQAVSGDEFRQMREDADLYPYWVYVETTSLHPREEHLALVGKIFRIGDPEGDMCYPPNGFNCSCSSDQIDDLGEKGVSKGSDSIKDIDPQFRFNPADQGILPKESHSYFQSLNNANDADWNNFSDLDKLDDAEGLKAKGLHLLVQSYHDWQHKYKVRETDIIFQNKETLTNIVFNHSSFQAIQKHPGDVDKLPSTVSGPQEIWQMWGDKDQRIVNRIYIKDGYCVSTVDGIIKDAWAGNVNQYRKGVII